MILLCPPLLRRYLIYPTFCLGFREETFLSLSQHRTYLSPPQPTFRLPATRGGEGVGVGGRYLGLLACTDMATELEEI